MTHSEVNRICLERRKNLVSDIIPEDTYSKALSQHDMGQTQTNMKKQEPTSATDHKYIICKTYGESQQIADAQSSATEDQMPGHFSAEAIKEMTEHEITQDKVDTLEYRAAYQKLVTISKTPQHYGYANLESTLDLESLNKSADLNERSHPTCDDRLGSSTLVKVDFYEGISPLLEDQQNKSSLLLYDHRVPSPIPADEQEQHKSMILREELQRKSSPESESSDRVEASLVPKINVFPDELLSTKEELDDFLWIQSLAEDTSEIKPIQAPPTASLEILNLDITNRKSDEMPSSSVQIIPKVDIISEREDSKEESELTSGGDQETSSEVESSMEEHILYERSSSQLERQHDRLSSVRDYRNVPLPTPVVELESDENLTLRQQPPPRSPLPSQSYEKMEASPLEKPKAFEGAYLLTQEEIDHIAWIQHLADETLKSTPLRSLSNAIVENPQEDHCVPKEVEPLPSPVDISQSPSIIPEEDQFEDESEPTSGADEGTSSKVDFSTKEHILYERSSSPTDHKSAPLLDVQQVLSQSQSVNKIKASPLAELRLFEGGHLISQEELDHIAWIQHLAEETSEAKPIEAPPTSSVENLHEDLDIQKDNETLPSLVQVSPDTSVISEREESKEESESTSGADQETFSEVVSPTEEHVLDERSSPVLEHQHDRSSPVLDHELAHLPAPAVDLESDENMMLEQEPPPRPPPPSKGKDKVDSSPLMKSKVFEEEHLLTQEELDHIARIQRLAEETIEMKNVGAPEISSVESLQGDIASRKADELPSSSMQAFPSFNLASEQDESKEESEPGSGADQETSSVVESSTEEHVLFERSSPVLEGQHDRLSPVLDHELAHLPAPTVDLEPGENMMPEQEPPLRPSLSPQSDDKVHTSPLTKPKLFEKEYLLTEEELDHIAWIQRLAVDSLEAKDTEDPLTASAGNLHGDIASRSEDKLLSSSLHVLPSCIITLEQEESKDESEPTSGADQGSLSEVESPTDLSAPTVDLEPGENMMLEQEPPLRPPPPSKGEEKVDSSPLTKSNVFEEEHLLTQEELDHIARIQRLAEETLEMKPVGAPKISSVESLREDIASRKADELPSSSVLAFPSFNLTSEQEESKEESEPTSGADQGTTSEVESLSEEHVLYERLSPVLGDQHDRSSPVLDHELAYLPAPTVDLEPGENMMLEQEPPLRPPPPSKGEDKVDSSPLTKSKVFEEGHLLTEEELDHIARIQRLAEETLEVKNLEAPKISSVENLKGGIAIRKVNELLSSSVQAFPSFNLTSEQEESNEESEPTSGADQGTSSEVESPTEVHNAYDRYPPLLGDQHDSPSPATDDHHIASPTPVVEQASNENMMLGHEAPRIRPFSSPCERIVDASLLAKPKIFEKDYLLTQEELDHIAWIQHLAEETLEANPIEAPRTASVGNLHGDITIEKDDEVLSFSMEASSSVRIISKQQESAEKSESVSGADEGASSEVKSPTEEQTRYQMSSPLLEDQHDRTSPVLDDHHVPLPTPIVDLESDENMMLGEQSPQRPLLPSHNADEVEASTSRKSDVLEKEHLLTQKELDHIAWIQRLAEDTLEVKLIDVPSSASAGKLHGEIASRKEDVLFSLSVHVLPTYIIKLEQEESKDESQQTSRADERTPLEGDFPTDGHAVHERSSPLLEHEHYRSFPILDDQSVPSSQIFGGQEPSKSMKPNILNEEHLLTQEELVQTALIQRLAEETSETEPIKAPPTDSAENLQGDLNSQNKNESLPSSVQIFSSTRVISEREELKDESELTSGADQEISSEVHSPIVEHIVDERSFPLLEHEHDRSFPLLDDQHVPSSSQIVDRQGAPPSMKPNLLGEEHLLTQKELDHILWIQRLPEEILETRPIEPSPTAPVKNLQGALNIQKDNKPLSSFRQVLPSADVISERDESKEESESTSGADEGTSSEVESPNGEPDFLERSTPVLENQHNSSFQMLNYKQIPSSLQIVDEQEAPLSMELSELEREHSLTQEELDHIAWVQRLAEKTLEVNSIGAPPTASVGSLHGKITIGKDDEILSFSVQAPPNIPMISEQHESLEKSEPTSGADELASSEVESPTEERNFHKKSCPLIEYQHDRTSPLLNDHHVPLSTRVVELESDENMMLGEQPPQLPLLPSQSVDEVEASSSRKPDVFEKEHLLAEEELDHIAWIQRLSEGTLEVGPNEASTTASFGSLQGDTARQMVDELASSSAHLSSSFNINLDREESKEESEPTSGADQEQLSDVECATEEHDLNERSTPMLEDHLPLPIPFVDLQSHENLMICQKPPPSPSPTSQSKDKVDGFPLAKPKVFEEQYLLTQEELDHIAWIQRLAEETLEANAIIAPTTGSLENLQADLNLQKKNEPLLSSVQISPCANVISEQEEFKEESEETSGADQGSPSEEKLPTEKHFLYKSWSPLLDHGYGRPFPLFDDQHVPSSSEIADKEKAPLLTKSELLQEEHLLTQEELDHTAWIQRLAEKTVEAKPIETPPTVSVENLQIHLNSQKEMNRCHLQSNFYQALV
ncbi:hypothetical protein KIN20_022697 [Parelaphostrongylus tenuis]|uniref:Uncharacterized protein n=1 Tax=Parelaphostrongylus tenuis TaxID=148309 RepID=A0AAD5N9B0_PARTN|nr:hypothetical protein KIN20_022697 [Parelaphostrongylus tenuis]